MSTQIGYVFWHWPRPRTPKKAYERKLLAFQESLRSHPPDGFVDALCFCERRAPWSRVGRTTYEDWYLVSDFRSLGALNEAAVAKPSRRAHDEVAEDAFDGAGGVYRLRGGGLRLRDARFATWVSKPARTPYQAFIDGLSRLTGGRKTDLWQRQMVLGPAPEFCVHSDVPLKLPEKLRPVTEPLRLVEEDGR